MSEKIKLAYNWIGPRGPIPNTEVPNILTMSNVMTGVEVHTRRFWADNIWSMIFSNHKDYVLSPVRDLNQDDIFIYPFNVMWRIDFERYFYDDHGLIEYSMMPQHILHHIKMSKGYILIECAAEAFASARFFRRMHSYFEHYNIPLSKIIYLTGCSNANVLYDRWLSEQNITDPTNKMNLIPFPISQHAISVHFANDKPEEPEYNTEVVPEKLFLVWNRRFRPHRIANVLGLAKLNLDTRSYISMGLTDPENADKNIATVNNSYLTDGFLNINDEECVRFANRLPLILDGETDTHKMCADFDNACRPFYQNSLVSIVTETNFIDDEVSLTEKSFKPSKEKHPFILVGSQGALQALRNMGFKTFGDFWDENYDNIYDPKQRMLALYDIYKYIGSWTNEQIIDFRRKVKPILDHNYEMVKRPYADRLGDKIKFSIMSKQIQSQIPGDIIP